MVEGNKEKKADVTKNVCVDENHSKYKIITDLNGNASVNMSHPEVKEAMLDLMVELHETLPKK